MYWYVTISSTGNAFDFGDMYRYSQDADLVQISEDMWWSIYRVVLIPVSDDTELRFTIASKGNSINFWWEINYFSGRKHLGS